MSLLRALHNLWLWLFWSFVEWCARPSHPSLIHALWMRHQSRARLQRFIERGE